MDLKLKKTMIILLIICRFVDTFQAFNGFLRQKDLFKEVRVSLSTEKFIKNIVKAEQQLLKRLNKNTEAILYDLMLSSIRLDLALAQEVFFSHDDYSTLFQLVSKEKALLFDEISIKLPEKKSKFAYDQTILLLQVAADALHSVGARGFEKEIGLIKVIIMQMMSQVCQGDYCIELRSKVLRTLSIVQEVISRFDGVLVTEYDIIVLSHVATAIFLISQIS